MEDKMMCWFITEVFFCIKRLTKRKRLDRGIVAKKKEEASARPPFGLKTKMRPVLE